MNQTSPTTQKNETVPRPPVVAVMGHIDHGKSTLLDYIRKTTVAEQETGGITQHLGAYEVVHTAKDGIKHTITFLDTPGHEAFKGIRERGATVADIAILVVSGEEGVKPQTIEALSLIKKAKTPFIVAITKIDKPTANAERAKQSLAEKEIYVEGYGGDIPCIPLSSKTGEAVEDLLDMIVLMAEMHNVHAEAGAPMRGFVIEASIEKSKGISATLVIKEGVLKTGEFVVAEGAIAPARRLENFLGKTIEEATAGMPVRVIGWSEIPRIGATAVIAKDKREAGKLAEEAHERSTAKPKKSAPSSGAGAEENAVLCLIIKADAGGSLEAAEHEIAKCATDKVAIRIISKGIGAIGENDLKIARGSRDPVLIGFNVGIDRPAKRVIERRRVQVATFEVIYKLIEWLQDIIKTRTPKIRVEELTGSARILKIFTTEKDKQVIGGKVLDGEIAVGNEFKVLRRDTVIGTGKIRELQKFKEKISAVPKDNEFGAFVWSTVEIMPSDRIEAFTIVEK